MFRIFVFVIFVLFLIEVGGLLVVGQVIGTLPVLGLLIAGVFFGGRLIKQSSGVLSGLRRQGMANPVSLSKALAGGLLKAVAGLLFILPGFVSDLLGFLLLLPPVGAWLASKFKPTSSNFHYGQSQAPVIEGEIISSNDNVGPAPKQFPKR